MLGKWVGYDVPDFAATKTPTAKADPAKTGLAAQSGTDPFIMKADGKGWLFAPKGLAEGPLPEHYEPLESPVKNPLSSVQNNPVIKVFDTDADQDIGDKVGTAEQFPIVCTTYRLAEHWQTGTMSRTLPWLAEAQPEMFVEISKELAQEKGHQERRPGRRQLGARGDPDGGHGHRPLEAAEHQRPASPSSRHAVALRLAGAGHRRGGQRPDAPCRRWQHDDPGVQGVPGGREEGMTEGRSTAPGSSRRVVSDMSCSQC